MTADIAIKDAFVEWRADIDSEPFAHEQFWVDSAAVKPGWCILHGLQEPCFKCNLPHTREEAASHG